MPEINKKKILYVITKSNWGGAQKYVYDLATSEIGEKYDINVFVGGDGELISRLEDKGIKVIRSSRLKNTMNPIKGLYMFLEMYKVLKGNNFDIVHINSSIAGVIGSLVCKLTGTKSIFTAHAWPQNENRPLLIKAIFKLLMLSVVAITNRTIAVSKNIQDNLTNISFIKNKISLIYLGAEKIKSKNLPKLSTGSKMTHIVSIGEMNRNKNHISFIQILKQVKNVHYHIIGADTGEGERIKEYIKKEKLEKKVTLHGHIKSASAILSQFDIFLLPSYTEALGYVVVEALQNGLPVIARRVGGVPEIIDGLDYCALYTEDKELIELIPKIIETNKNKEITWDSQKFLYQNMIDETIDIYKSF